MSTSGETCNPYIVASSPVFTTAVSAPRGSARCSPRSSLAPPTPPARAVTRIFSDPSFAAAPGVVPFRRADSLPRMTVRDRLVDRAAAGEALADAEVRELAQTCRDDAAPLLAAAAALRDAHHGPRITFSKKVFIPLTKLCRDSCGYCTFARPPQPGERAYLSLEEVVAIARAGREAGCAEALFTLGDKPERKWHEAREELDALGYATTIDYLVDACKAVLEETGLIPHANPGALTP